LFLDRIGLVTRAESKPTEIDRNSEDVEGSEEVLLLLREEQMLLTTAVAAEGPYQNF